MDKWQLDEGGVVRGKLHSSPHFSSLPPPYYCSLNVRKKFCSKVFRLKLPERRHPLLFWVSFLSSAPQLNSTCQIKQVHKNTKTPSSCFLHLEKELSGKCGESRGERRALRVERSSSLCTAAEQKTKTCCSGGLDNIKCAVALLLYRPGMKRVSGILWPKNRRCDS